jgi:hypothetical protein
MHGCFFQITYFLITFGQIVVQGRKGALNSVIANRFCKLQRFLIPSNSFRSIKLNPGSKPGDKTSFKVISSFVPALKEKNCHFFKFTLLF